MNHREETLGIVYRFLMPSLKLKDRDNEGRSREESLHRYLLERFGGYTATAANIYGYWKDARGADVYGEHKEYTVALKEPGLLPELKRFLAKQTREMREQSLYVEEGEEARLLIPID
ncbi:MAG: hypothetical protein SFV54_21650 [Bryobacteraceae bacterium]|nr:hypothetical protein [Bryobacteraceae bacterium]